MCIIIYKPSVVAPESTPPVVTEGEGEAQARPPILDVDTFLRLGEHHPHGVGMMWTSRGKVRIWKRAGLRGWSSTPEEESAWEATVRAAYKLYRQLDSQGKDVVIHFRYATHGKGEHMLANTHPFYLPGWDEKLGYCHNGVIDIMTPKDDSVSDTRMFGEHVLANLAGDFREDAVLWNTLEKRVLGGGNKVVMMDHEGRVDIMNERSGMWVDGVWYSNDSFRPTYHRYSKGSQGSTGTGEGWRNRYGSAPVTPVLPRTTVAKQKPAKVVGAKVAESFLSNKSTAALLVNGKTTLCRVCVEHFSNLLSGPAGADTYPLMGTAETDGLVCDHCTQNVQWVFRNPEEAKGKRDEIVKARAEARVVKRNAGAEAAREHAAAAPAPLTEPEHRALMLGFAQDLSRCALALAPEADGLSTFEARAERYLSVGCCDLGKTERAVASKLREAVWHNKDEGAQAYAFLKSLSLAETGDLQDVEVGTAFLCDAASTALYNGINVFGADGNDPLGIMELLGWATKLVEEQEEEEAESAGEEADTEATEPEPSQLELLDEKPQPGALADVPTAVLYRVKLVDEKALRHGWTVVFMRQGGRTYLPPRPGGEPVASKVTATYILPGTDSTLRRHENGDFSLRRTLSRAAVQEEVNNLAALAAAAGGEGAE